MDSDLDSALARRDRTTREKGDVALKRILLVFRHLDLPVSVAGW